MIPIALVYSEFYNNGENGIAAFQLTEEDDNNKVVIEDMTAKNSQDTGFFSGSGMYLAGTGITVNNANIKNNVLSGIEIGAGVVNEITLAGDVTITNNEIAGIITEDSSVQGTVHVTGNLDLNRNGEYGVATNSADLTVAVGGSYSGKSGKSGSGSLTACDNGVWDIYNYVGGTFEGTDYTCDMTKTAGPVPECEPCQPGCSSSDPGTGSGRSLSNFVAKEMDMEPLYPIFLGN